MVSIVPDRVDGSTHTYFLAFPSSSMAEAQMAGWKERNEWEFALVTEEELQVFVTCTESTKMAVRDGVQVPETASMSRALISTSG